jgi:hypothetical protein
MKKMVFLLAALSTLAISVNAFAFTEATAWLTRDAGGNVAIPHTDPRQPLNLKPSANVFFAWGVDVGGAAYSIGTVHTSGTFVYATSSVDTNIYRMPVTSNDMSVTTTAPFTLTLTAVTVPAVPPSTTVGATWTGWTAAK